MIDPGIPLNWDDLPPTTCRGGVLAIGNFDGVHRGHAALVAELREQARAVNGPAVVVSFDPHPLLLLAPQRFQPLLTTPAERATVLRSLGVDAVVYLRTVPELLALDAATFFDRIIHHGFAARGLVEGFNFRFGRDRAGSNDTLRQLGSAVGIGFREVPPFTLDGLPVSSSRVREALLAGQADQATTLLGRPYRLTGIVGSGARRGRTIGFPTANLEQVATLVPREGVYAVRAWLGSTAWPAAANIGPNPTFGEHARKLEVHLLDFSGDLYGQEVSIDFVAHLRDTRPFPDRDALIAQLQQDIARTRELLAS